MRTPNIGLLALVPIVATFASQPASSVPTDVCCTESVTATGPKEEMAGSDTADVIRTGTGFTFVYGHGGPDRICGSGGHDSVWGGPGNDRVTAGAGWDVVDGGDELTVLSSGNDTLYGAAGNDTLAGDADPTSYVAPGVGIKGGSSGHVPLRGEAVGADRLRGVPGDDLLRGGPGPDSLFGGAGEGILLGGPAVTSWSAAPATTPSSVVAYMTCASSVKAPTRSNPANWSGSTNPDWVCPATTWVPRPASCR